MKEQTGNRIILFSFVLTVFVIWLHAGESLISSIPGQIAVPGFFILSGFLFFRIPSGTFPDQPAGDVSSEAAKTESTGDVSSEATKTESGFFPGWMRTKLLRRLRTLLIPYLTWNTIYFLIYLAVGKASIGELPQAVFHYSCNPVFWYLFQLNLITAVTPLLYQLMKRKWTAILWLAVIFTAAVFYSEIHAVIPFSFINEDALFYYSAGAFLSMYVAKPGGEESRRLTGISAGACAGLLLLFTGLQYFVPDAVCNAAVIGQRLAGALLVWFLTGLVKRDGSVRVFPWMKITFFIYATHYMVIRAVWAAEIALGLNGNEFANIVTYLIMPAVCTAAAYGLYILMKKTMPKVLGFLTGNRGE